MTERISGKISGWKDDRGFGYIEPLDGTARVFVHISAFPRGPRRPVEGEVVSFQHGIDARRRPCATEVLFEVPEPARRPRPEAWAGALLPPIVVATLTAMAVLDQLPLIVPAFCLLTSTITFFVYRSDKALAQRRGWRISENTLLLLGLCGGWPGALAAQRLLRHKCRKGQFQLTFWLTVAANCALVTAIWYIRPDRVRLWPW